MIDRTEQEIMKNWKGDITKPLVSVCTITYNHEKYIAEAIDSFLMQETDFHFEIVIDDDCSTDNNAQIIKEYADKFPNIIKVNLREKNVGMMANFIANMKRTQGKYIALCEGDDYWTDSLKLQVQVDFLEKNEDYVYCFHDIDLYIDTEKKFIKNRSSHHNEKFKGDTYYPERILSSRFSFNTLSLMFRNIVTIPSCFSKLPYGDKSLEKLFAFYGKGYFIDKSRGVYRVHQNSVTHTVSYKAFDSKSNDVILYECLKKNFPNKYEQILQTRIDFHKSFIDNKCKLDIDKIKIFYRHASLVSSEKKILSKLYFLYYLVDCKDYKLLKRIIQKILFRYSRSL